MIETVTQAARLVSTYKFAVTSVLIADSIEIL